MDDCQLENLAIKEIIEEVEREKCNEIQSTSKRPPRSNVRPNKRFLGRTIVSVLHHNERQHKQERRNSSRKLRELERHRRRRQRARSEENERVTEAPATEERKVQVDPFRDFVPKNITTYLLGSMQQLLQNIQRVPKKKKKKKTLTIDLTTKKKRAKEKRKQKTRQKSHKSKKRKRQNKRSSSSSSSSSSVCKLSGSDSDGMDSESSVLLIDLT